jgi:hypothetical protein
MSIYQLNRQGNILTVIGSVGKRKEKHERHLREFLFMFYLSDKIKQTSGKVYFYNRDKFIALKDQSVRQ